MTRVFAALILMGSGCAVLEMSSVAARVVGSEFGEVRAAVSMPGGPQVGMTFDSAGGASMECGVLLTPTVPNQGMLLTIGARVGQVDNVYVAARAVVAWVAIDEQQRMVGLGAIVESREDGVHKDAFVGIGFGF